MAILGLKNDNNAGKDSEIFHFPTSKNVLIIFTRNPELGKCKTRLAGTVGDDAALKIYKFLLNHTVAITTPLKADKFVYYSEKLREGDVWNSNNYRKKVQKGDDLGLRMDQAFKEVFELGYERAMVIGSDMYDMTTDDLSNGFDQLNDNDFVLGPAEDGGYYLLGMKKLNSEIFQNKAWGTDTVLRDTLADLKKEQVTLLEEKNDVDYYEDIKNIYAFQEFFPSELKKTKD
ncbi:MAG: rSAM/selenodomain-associated transferase 1 [Planctomycetota bacterium]|jgi:rSAM/selenodomain-associated transferase 1